jgi:hypothetical protein
MTEKTITTRVLLSVHTACGVPGVTFDAIHEVIEHLIGEPVWTHQLALPSVWEAAKAEIDRQCIGFTRVDADALRSVCEGKDGDEREAAAEAWTVDAIALVGRESFTVAQGKGTGRTDMEIGADAMSSLVAMAGDRPVLVVEVGSGTP